MKIYLLKDYVGNLDGDTLLAYVALRSIYHKNEDELYVSINMLCYRLFGNTTYSRTFKDSITSGLSNLVQRGVVVVKEQINKTEFILDAKGLYFEDEYFVGIDLEYIRMACNINSRVDRGSLVKYLLTMVSTLCNDPYRYPGYIFGKRQGFAGFMPISYIAAEAGVSEQTALSYNTILEENKIVFIYRHGHYYQDVLGELKTINNNYGLYDDKDLIIKFGDNIAEMHGFESQTRIKNRAQANTRRSLAAKYRGLCNGVEYTKEEVQEIYEYIHAENIKLQEMIDRQYKVEELTAKLRDESVFEGMI